MLVRHSNLIFNCGSFNGNVIAPLPLPMPIDGAIDSIKTVSPQLNKMWLSKRMGFARELPPRVRF